MVFPKCHNTCIYRSQLWSLKTIFVDVSSRRLGAGKNDMMSIEMCHTLAVESSIPKRNRGSFEKKKVNYYSKDFFFSKCLKGTDSCSFSWMLVTAAYLQNRTRSALCSRTNQSKGTTKKLEIFFWIWIWCSVHVSSI